MGCASSKEKVCQNCQAPYLSPTRRSYSVDYTHRLPFKAEDGSRHVVALTSSTLGTLRLDDKQNPTDADDKPSSTESGDDFTMQMIEAKTWSEMIDSKIPKITPKTPVITPPGEPETVINAWELMEGLEDVSPLRPATHHIRSFSFQAPPRNNSLLLSIEDQPTTPRVVKEQGDDESLPKNIWSASDLADSDTNSNSNDSSIIESEFDPKVIASFRRSLEELPQTNPFHLNLEPPKESKGCIKDKPIVYFTSLRGVRKTYEDCCHVRVILKGLKVKIDERDVSMHSGFKDELRELLGQGFGGSILPKVFMGGKCIGGADEIRRLNEDGKLEKMFENCEMIEGSNDGGKGDVCDACGDIRFVPCESCSGSCKVYHGDDEEEEEGEGDGESEHEYGFRRCPDCNENGLVRCPICC